MIIRPVRVDDADDVHALRLQEGVRETISALPSDRVVEVRNRLAALGPDVHFLVAEVDGRVVAEGALRVRDGRARHSGTVGLSVAREHQRKGIGRALLQRLLDVADRDLRLRRVELDVMADHAHAIRLYESLGFEHEGRKRDAVVRDGRYVDLLLMARLR